MKKKYEKPQEEPTTLNEPTTVYGNVPFTPVAEEKKKSFQEAAKECNAVSVDEFFDELDERIRTRFNHA